LISCFGYQFKGVLSRSRRGLAFNTGDCGPNSKTFVAEIDCKRLKRLPTAVTIRGGSSSVVTRIGDLVHIANWTGWPASRIVGTGYSRATDRLANSFARSKSRVKFSRDVRWIHLSVCTGEPSTLSGGEAQRIRLAAQLGSGLCGVLYVLDETTIGLHPRANLPTALRRLQIDWRDQGNTLIVRRARP